MVGGKGGIKYVAREGGAGGVSNIYAIAGALHGGAKI